MLPRHALIAFCSLASTAHGFGIDPVSLPPGVAAATAAVAALGGVAAGRLEKSDADDRWLNDWTQKTRGAAT